MFSDLTANRCIKAYLLLSTSAFADWVANPSSSSALRPSDQDLLFVSMVEKPLLQMKDSRFVSIQLLRDFQNEFHDLQNPSVGDPPYMFL
ncbi:hypothetical protein L6452_44188 [Arctium lappa]|uniref:Uncharacterized protein n=1 Tax=Arctium lappa TaxID=4217 RepID=A0ACB8XG57_ARCLA|nr:hypothetical protein L6452_44188 [Arctium lappa]